MLFSPISPPDDLSPLARGFLTWALNRTPWLRPSVQEMLHHPWLHHGSVPASSPKPQVSGASTSSSDVWPASAPHATVLPMCADAASEACLNSTAEEDLIEQHGRPSGRPGRRILGFVPIATAPSSSSASSLQLSGDAMRGEAVQLSGMHRAIIDALRHRSPTCSLTARSQLSQQPSAQLLHKSVSTSTCACSSGTASYACSDALPSRSQSSLQLRATATPRPPPRVSSLTQALSLQRGMSLSDPASPRPCSGRQLPSDGLPSLSPLTYSSGQTAAAVRQPTPDPLARRSPGVPRANVTVIYACNEDAAQAAQQPEQFGTEDGSFGHGASRLESRESTFAAAEATVSSFQAPTLSPGPPAHVALPQQFELPAALHHDAPDSVMKRVAASVFTDAARGRPGTVASADLDAVQLPVVRSPAPGVQCSACGAPGRDFGRCSDCQAAADLASIWQRAAGPSPIQRQLCAFDRGTGEQVGKEFVGGEHRSTPSSQLQGVQAADDADDDRISAPAASTQSSGGVRHPEKVDACPQAVSDLGCTGSSVEERRYEVRGSWGGSIDSTAGARHAHLSKQVETTRIPDGFMADGAHVRVASWVANAAAALWDASSEDSGDALDGMASAAACRSSELGSDAVSGVRTVAGRNQSTTSSSVVDRLKQGTQSLQVWETHAALSSQGLDGLFPGPHAGPVGKWPNGAANAGRKTATSSAEGNWVARTHQGKAPDGGSGGGGTRPLLQSYGVDCSTVSLHAVAAALTPSMTGPSVLRSSPVYPDAQDE